MITMASVMFGTEYVRRVYLIFKTKKTSMIAQKRAMLVYILTAP